jgi:DNA polymerase-3 subunit gamma/tau
MREIAAGFSEEDLTRYLQLVLDLFKDLQSSQQPRLHLEIGLLRLVHASRLISIEEALAGMTAPAAPQAKPQPTAAKPMAPPPAPARPVAPAPRGPSPFERDTAKKADADTPPWAPVPATAPPQSKPAPESKPAPANPPSSGELKDKMHEALVELGMAFTADAVEHSLVTEQGGEVAFVTPKEFKLSMTPLDLQKAAQQVFGKPMRVKVTVGETGITEAPKPRKESVGEEATTQRALADPGVQRFQELFPDAQVRAVRNLKE